MIVQPDADLRFSALLEDGDLIVTGSGIGEPESLIRQLDRQRALLPSVGLFAGISYTDAITPELATATSLSSFGGMGTIAPLAAAGLVNVLPVNYVDVARHLRARGANGIVLMVQVSRADEGGMHSFGSAVDYTAELIEDARLVIAEVNDKLAPVPGPGIHTSRIGARIEVSRALREIPSAPVEDLHRRIAENVLALIPDGATLQLGIGSVPSAVAALLADQRTGLRVHTGLAGDWLLDLHRNAALDPEAQIIVGGAAGSRELYEFLAADPRVMVRTISSLTPPSATAHLSNFVALNSAVQVDLTGQVNAEVAGTRYLGGIGGQVDFLRGAQLSPDGRAIIVLPSTASGGKRSRIVANLDHGTVTTPRSGLDFVITEFGIADLRGKGLSERADALVAIADPRFRDQLATALS